MPAAPARQPRAGARNLRGARLSKKTLSKEPVRSPPLHWSDRLEKAITNLISINLGSKMIWSRQWLIRDQSVFERPQRPTPMHLAVMHLALHERVRMENNANIVLYYHGFEIPTLFINPFTFRWSNTWALLCWWNLWRSSFWSVTQPQFDGRHTRSFSHCIGKSIFNGRIYLSTSAFFCTAVNKMI